MKTANLLSCILPLSNCFCLSASPAKDAERPNIVFIVAEDMSLDLGCYGSMFMKTPYIDKLASKGVLFENAYATQASSGPSRSSIFTGLYPHENGQIGLPNNGYTMHRNVPNLIQYLKQCDYYTIGMGKIGVDPEDEFKYDLYKGGGDSNPYYYKEQVGNILSNVPDKPFFMMICLQDAHLIKNSYYEIPEGYDGEIMTEDQIKKPSWFGGITNEARSGELLGYYNAVKRVDHTVGLIEEELIKRGLEKSTLVVFISDNGAPMLRAKTTIYESGIKLPLIVKWPGHVKENFRSEKLVSFTDLFPTFMELAGGSVPSPISGMSLMPLCRGEEVHWREILFAEWNSDIISNFQPQRSVRNARYKLIENFFSGEPKHVISDVSVILQTNKDMDPEAESHYRMLLDPPRYELYDLKEDPDEFVNLADNNEFTKIKEELILKLDEWQKSTNDYLICDINRFKAISETHKKALMKTGNEKGAFNMVQFQKDWNDVKKEYSINK